jgi:hypothetical protein
MIGARSKLPLLLLLLQHLLQKTCQAVSTVVAAATVRHLTLLLLLHVGLRQLQQPCSNSSKTC